MAKWRMFGVVVGAILTLAACSDEPEEVTVGAASDVAEASVDEPSEGALTLAPIDLSGTSWFVVNIDGVPTRVEPPADSFFRLGEKLELSIADNCGTARVSFTADTPLTPAKVEQLETLCHDGWQTAFMAGTPVNITATDTLLIKGDRFLAEAEHVVSVSQTGRVDFGDSMDIDLVEIEPTIVTTTTLGPIVTTTVGPVD